ncbi:MAG: parallel beta-helix domain-containing protein [Saprospiraceae bacterium]
MKLFSKIMLFSISILTVFSCQEASNEITLTSENMVSDLQRTLIEAKEGAVIIMPEGSYEFNRPISLNDIPKVTLKGAGMKKTILSFKEQIEGGEGMIVKSIDGLTLEGFTIADSKGDALKVQDCKNVVIRAVETTWTGGKLATNGGYGLYPVTCTNVLMEDCEASFAMDAGIYLGQSTNAVVRNNYVHNNVAGIEIENTINADVYGNKAVENTGGLLIFDMPDLPQANGNNIKVHDNMVENNNGENFSPEGIVVHILPPGTGVLIMAHKNIELFNNEIKGHNTVSIAINSWQFTGRTYKSEAYDPFCHGLNIYNNKIAMGEGNTDVTTDFGKLFTALGQGKPIGIAYDGVINPTHFNEDGTMKTEHKICIRENGEVPFMNLNAYKAMGENGLDMTKLASAIEMDASRFDCEVAPLNLGDFSTWLAE